MENQSNLPVIAHHGVISLHRESTSLPVRTHTCIFMRLRVKVHTLTHTEGGTCANTIAKNISPSLSRTHTGDKPAQSINIFMLQTFTFQVNHRSLHPLSVFLPIFPPHIPFIVHLVKQRRRRLPTLQAVVYPHTSILVPSITLLHCNIPLKT